jgi:phosphoglycolate phosphatase
MGLEDQVGAYAGRDSTWRMKPHPQPVLHAAHQLKVPPERCLMVGDTTVDIRAGIRAGAWTCGVLCGYGMRDELENAGAHFILPTTAHLADVLLNGRDPEGLS